jgi:uncharacterized protein YggU (UPF0235/DUF167 family)
MLHTWVACARVIPRSRKTGVEAKPDGIVVRVRAAPQGGRATEEARRALAVALGIPPSEVILHRGQRSREKIFDLVRDDGSTSAATPPGLIDAAGSSGMADAPTCYPSPP